MPLTRLAATRLRHPLPQGERVRCPLLATRESRAQSPFEPPHYSRPVSISSANDIVEKIACGEARSITLSPCGRGSREGRGEGYRGHSLYESNFGNAALVSSGLARRGNRQRRRLRGCFRTHPLSGAYTAARSAFGTAHCQGSDIPAV